MQSTVENVKDELYLSSKISNDLIVDSISTMANIKALDQHISDLNQQRQQLVQELDTFYNHTEAVTKSQFVYFNKLSLFHDVQQWLKSAEDTNEKWRINAENTKLVTNELNHLKAQLDENNKEIAGLFDFINVGTEEDFTNIMKITKHTLVI